MIFGRFLDFGPKQPAVMSSSPSSARVDRSNAEEEDARRVRESLMRINNCIRPNQGSEYRSKKITKRSEKFFFLQSEQFFYYAKNCEIAKFFGYFNYFKFLSFPSWFSWISRFLCENFKFLHKLPRVSESNSDLIIAAGFCSFISENAGDWIGPSVFIIIARNTSVRVILSFGFR